MIARSLELPSAGANAAAPTGKVWGLERGPVTRVCLDCPPFARLHARCIQAAGKSATSTAAEPGQGTVFYKYLFTINVLRGMAGPA
jgi:hypothetical protein